MRCNRPLLKFTFNTLLASCLLTFLINIGVVSTLAQSRRYTPPRGGTPPASTGIGGARGGSCTGEANATFTALAPYSHIGQTSATHPTFAWYVPERLPYTVDFRLYRYGADGKLQHQPVYQTELSSTTGVMTFTLPQSEPALVVGQHYFWQAALICDPNHGSEDLIISAEMRIVENTLPESERWYDLLRAGLETAQSQSAAALLLELAALEKASGEDLARSASTATEGDRGRLSERSQATLQHSQDLTQVAGVGR